MSRCGFAFKDLRTINQETPDVIGFNSNGTFLLEAKCSRSDFLADKKKIFRKNQWMGMGDFRFYIAPEGLIKEEELPDMWGLIEIHKNGKPKVVSNPFGRGNIYGSWKRNEKNEKAEKAMLYSALRRLQELDRIKEIYEPMGSPKL